MEVVAECAKNNRASKSKYRRVWRALVACTEGVLSSGRGVIVEKVSASFRTSQNKYCRESGVRAIEGPDRSGRVAPSPKVGRHIVDT